MTDIYHITHIRNITPILEQSGLHCDTSISERRFDSTRIGDLGLKGRRSRTSVPIEPRGTLSDYVPFYFAPRSPMLYVISNGGVPGYTQGQAPVVHLVASAEEVQQNNLDFVFTDGHAYMAFSQYFNDLTKLDQIDWDIMQAKYWSDTHEDGDRSRRRQAEFLVHHFFPWHLIKEIGVINTRMATEVKTILASAKHQPTVTVNRHWYY